jgi:hypothetical protein
MWMVGPSRPTLMPLPSDRTPPTSLTGSTRKGPSLRTPASAPSISWMPLPAASGAENRT